MLKRSHSLYNSCSKIITQPFFNLFICSSYFLSSYLTLSLGWLCYRSCRYNFHMHVQRSMCTNMLPSGEPYSYRFSCLCIWMLVSVTYMVIIHGTTHIPAHIPLWMRDVQSVTGWRRCPVGRKNCQRNFTFLLCTASVLLSLCQTLSSTSYWLCFRREYVWVSVCFFVQKFSKAEHLYISTYFERKNNKVVVQMCLVVSF